METIRRRSFPFGLLHSPFEGMKTDEKRAKLG